MAAQLFDLPNEALKDLPKGDCRKGLVAAQIHERALVPNNWVAQRLQMGATGAVSRTIARARELVKSDRGLASLAKRLAADVNCF